MGGDPVLRSAEDTVSNRSMLKFGCEAHREPTRRVALVLERASRNHKVSLSTSQRYTSWASRQLRIAKAGFGPGRQRGLPPPLARGLCLASRDGDSSGPQQSYPWCRGQDWRDPSSNALGPIAQFVEAAPRWVPGTGCESVQAHRQKPTTERIPAAPGARSSAARRGRRK